MMLKIKFSFIRGIEIPDEINISDKSSILEFLINSFEVATEDHEIIRYYIEEILEPKDDRLLELIDCEI